MSPESRAAITVRNALTSPLLRLPAEIRNKIYAYAIFDGTYSYKRKLLSLRLGKKYSVPKHYSPLCTPREMGPAPSWKGFLATCRQIYTEASLLPYEQNTLRFQLRSTFLGILPKLATFSSPISSIRVELDEHSEVWKLEVVAKLPNLKKVEVVLLEKHLNFDNLWTHGSWSDDVENVQSEIRTSLVDAIDGNFEVVFVGQE